MKLLLSIVLCFALSIVSAQTSYKVLFEYDKANVPDTAMAALIRTIYSKNVKSIYLEGHCDSVGSRGYNYALSKRRVDAVKRLLIENGFSAEQISGKIGYGKDRPLNKNADSIQRQENRRVLVLFDYESKLFKKPKTEPKKITTSKKVTRTIDKISLPPKDDKKIIVKKAKAFTPSNFKKGNLIELPNLLFQGGRHYVIPKSRPVLDSLAQILLDNPSIKVEIQGHVCCTTHQPDGFDWDTLTENLSYNRAKAVMAFLISKGIDIKRLRIKGFGGSRKLFEDETYESKRAQNRRVEVLVLEE